MRKARWLVLGFVAALGGLAFATTWALAQSAGNPETEIKTAIAHAGYAGKADALNTVKLHLHHVLNCMVGPEGKQFDKAAGNPCQGQGNGAMPDLKAKMGEDARYYKASFVALIANQGISSNSLQEAKAAAQVAGLILEDAAKGK